MQVAEIGMTHIYGKTFWYNLLTLIMSFPFIKSTAKYEAAYTFNYCLPAFLAFLVCALKKSLATANTTIMYVNKN